MRIRSVDFTELFAPAVHLRVPDGLPGIPWGNLVHMRDSRHQLVRLAEGDSLVGDESESLFGGAIVLLQSPVPSSVLEQMVIVDGRKRLVTWQLMIDACRRTIEQHGAAMVARTLEPLLENPSHSITNDGQRRVVLPSQADRQEFAERLSLDSALLAENSGSHTGITTAHAWIMDATAEWLVRGDVVDRAQRLARVILHRIRVIVVEARAVENPVQVARQLTSSGTGVSAIDIVGQTLLDLLALPQQAADRAYQAFMAPLSDAWWSEPASGVLGTEPRHEQLLRAWIMARTGKVVYDFDLGPAFERYLRIATARPLDLLARLRDEAAPVRARLESALDPGSSDDPRTRFLYRMSALGSAEAIAALFWLDSDERASLSEDQRLVVLATIESHVVRRALTGLPHAGVGAGGQALLTYLMQYTGTRIGDDLAAATATQRDEEFYWPTDDDLRLVLPWRPVALELPESSARVILEALVEHQDGYGTVSRATTRVGLREATPEGDLDAAPVLRHVLGNLVLMDTWPPIDDNRDVPNRTVALIEACITLWPGPPNAVASAHDDEALAEALPWISSVGRS